MKFRLTFGSISIYRAITIICSSDKVLDCRVRLCSVPSWPSVRTRPTRSPIVKWLCLWPIALKRHRLSKSWAPLVTILKLTAWRRLRWASRFSFNRAFIIEIVCYRAKRCVCGRQSGSNRNRSEPESEQPPVAVWAAIIWNRTAMATKIPRTRAPFPLLPSRINSSVEVAPTSNSFDAQMSLPGV